LYFLKNLILKQNIASLIEEKLQNIRET